MPLLTLPRLTVDVFLTEYHPAMRDPLSGPLKICVWVNPPRGLLAEQSAIVARIKAAQVGADLAQEFAALARWFATIWSQGPDPATHCTEEEVRAILESDTDPRLWPWLQAQTIAAIRAHREEQQKK